MDALIKNHVLWFCILPLTSSLFYFLWKTTNYFNKDWKTIILRFFFLPLSSSLLSFLANTTLVTIYHQKKKKKKKKKKINNFFSIIFFSRRGREFKYGFSHRWKEAGHCHQTIRLLTTSYQLKFIFSLGTKL